MQPVKLNFQKDPPGNDKAFSKVVSKLLSGGTPLKSGDVIILPQYTPISNQGSLGSCVANAACDALELVMGIEKKDVVQLSRLFLYWNSRNYHGATQADTGTYVRAAFMAMKEHGVCDENSWPYDIAEFTHRPPLRCYENADSNKILDAYSIDTTGTSRLDQVELALRAHMPVVFGTDVGQEFLDYRGDDKTFTPPPSSKGGHAMVIVGVDRSSTRRRFYVRNSWGTGWGDGGYCWFDESYILWGETDSLWVPTRTPALITVD
jgi:C1A family cysteine protease